MDKAAASPQSPGSAKVKKSTSKPNVPSTAKWLADEQERVEKAQLKSPGSASSKKRPRSPEPPSPKRVEKRKSLFGAASDGEREEPASPKKPKSPKASASSSKSSSKPAVKSSSKPASKPKRSDGVSDQMVVGSSRSASKSSS